MNKQVKKNRFIKKFSIEQTEEEAGLSPSYNSKRKRGIIPITKNFILSVAAIFDVDAFSTIKKEDKQKATLFGKFEKWFDLNFGWFFVNGRKSDSWEYEDKRKIQG